MTKKTSAATGAETPHRLLLEAMNEGVLTLAADGTVLYCNSCFAAMAGRPVEQIVGAACRHCFSPGGYAAFQRQAEEAQKDGAKGELMLQAGDGSCLPVEVSMRPFKLNKADVLCVTVADVTGRKFSERAMLQANEDLEARVRERTFDLTIANEQLQQANRTLKALQESSQAMTRAASETEYLNEVCKTVIANCGHAMAWIGYAEQDEGRTVRPAAQAGFEEGFLKTLNISWADNERGRCPPARRYAPANRVCIERCRPTPPWNAGARKFSSADPFLPCSAAALQGQGLWQPHDLLAGCECLPGERHERPMAGRAKKSKR